MNKREKDEHFAAHAPGVLQYHQTMLSDGVRNALLYKAIKRHVSTETSFLDIGAGTGVWAIAAAKLGAKRVVAVEVEECLIPIIYKHAQENGVADRVEIIHGDSNDVKLRGRFDIIVSELFGSDALSKRVVDSFVDIRNRFLAPGGVLIPERLVNYAVPVRMESPTVKVGEKLPFSFEFIKSLKRNFSQTAAISDRKQLKFMADPKPLIELDFRSIEVAPALEFSAEWKLKDVSNVNAFAMFTRSIFAEGIEMNGLDSQSWGTMLYEFEPFVDGSNTIKFDLTMDEKKSIWTVSTASASGKKKSYSPAFAIARLRMSQQMTPHRKVRARKR